MIRIDTIHRIQELVDTDPDSQTLQLLFNTLAEEFGEVARIINGKPHDEDISHELSDVIIGALSMIYVAGEYQLIDVDELVNQKLDKWESKNIAASQLEEPIQ